VVLLAAFGLFARSFLKATTLDFGMAVDRLLVAHLVPFEDTLRIQQGRVATDAAMIADRLRAVPGVRVVSQTSMAPFLGYTYYTLRAEGVDTIPPDRSGPFGRLIDAEYVRVTGLRVLQGRDLTADDVLANAPVALVSAEMARAYWPSGQVLGRCLYVGTKGVVGRKDEPGADLCRTIVGVVSDYRAGILLYAPAEKHFYLPLGALPHQPVAQRSVLARTSVDPARLVTDARAIARSVWPDMRLTLVLPLRETLGPQLWPYQRGAVLLAVFGVLGVILAFGGVFSVVAYGVTQRRHELGIRVALGAAARHITRTVVRQIVVAITVGLAVGVAVALWAGNLVGGLLFELSPRDPIALGGAVCVLLIISLLACVAPIRTALRIAPTEALRAD
jgi:hypothetical protein